MTSFPSNHSPSEAFSRSEADVLEKSYTVTEFTQRLQTILEKALPGCWILGEISNFTEASSGHWYFNLKEAQAQIRCVMFRFRQSGSTVRPSNGMAVRLRGSLSYYAPNGTCQILVDNLRPAGLGALFEAFNRLKQQYAAAGLFDPARKRALPAMPRRVGVLTSPVGAAWRDVLTTLQRRAPQVILILYPIPVQGEGAAQQIAARLLEAGARAECDVLILCRGGGSMEDLWAFNEAPVVEALAACPIPVITGIGHETDFTLADFVADRRAPTPTAAAELVHPERQQLLHQLAQLEERHFLALRRRVEKIALHLDQHRLRWEHLQRRYWERQRQRLATLAQRLVHPGQRIAFQRQSLAALDQRWKQSRQRWFERQHQHLERQRRTLEHLNPRAILARGYALVQDDAGHVIDDATRLKPGDHVQLTLAHGTRHAAILPEADDLR